MSAQHSPGPWFIWKEKAMQEEGLEPDEIAYELSKANYFEVMSGVPIGEVTRGRIKGCRKVVMLDPDDFGDDEDEGRAIALANARLIAAAPDLLEALRSAVHLYTQYGLVSGAPVDGISGGRWVNEARAAIRKATGEQP